jgi:hypothetical protein
MAGQGQISRPNSRSREAASSRVRYGARLTKPFSRFDEVIRKRTGARFAPQGGDYDRVRHGSMCLVQHQHLRGSCFRRVSDALMGILIDRSTLPSADPSTVWLADLIEATEVVAASAKPCDPAIVKAFSDRLQKRADVTPLSEPDLMSANG